MSNITDFAVAIKNLEILRNALHLAPTFAIGG